VTGCMAERYRDELRVEIPEIDAVLGTGEVTGLVGVLSAAGSQASGVAAPMTFYARSPQAPAGPTDSRLPAPDVRLPAPDSRQFPPVFGVDLPTYLYDAATPRRRATPRHYAYVKIAEGCDYKCAFCIIPKMRGHYRSRTIDSVVQEARTLAADGVKELLLISQDTTFYGIDRGERGALPRLLRALNGVDGIEWIRMLYLYPTTITDEVIEAVAELDKVCKYIDLPLQHAADPVLKRMKRPGTRASYERLLGNIRARIPGVALRTTFIAGFPGETEQDVDVLERFITDVGFDHLGVFTYSHEEGTSAFGLEDDVPQVEKDARQARVMERQRGIVTRRQQARVGERVQLMIDGTSPEHEWVWRGRLAGQAPDIDPVVYLTDADPAHLAPGRLIEAEIVGAEAYDLVARPLAQAPA
jgi:ribosomal protein S12 methylthiotransferase